MSKVDVKKTIWVSEEHHRALKLIAVASGVPFQEIIAEIIAVGLEKRDKHSMEATA